MRSLRRRCPYVDNDGPSSTGWQCDKKLDADGKHGGNHIMKQGDQRVTISTCNEDFRVGDQQ